MKPFIYFFLILFVATFCTSKSSNESTQTPVTPTDEQIEEYLQKRESKQKQVEENEARRQRKEGDTTRKIIDLLRERDALMAKAKLKTIEMEREQTRLFRRYIDDTIVKWTSEIERDGRRVAQINGELKKLGYSEDVGIPNVSF
jgi:acetyl-CoA carboxylase carboxyltransferase component